MVVHLAVHKQVTPPARRGNPYGMQCAHNVTHFHALGIYTLHMYLLHTTLGPV